MTTFLFIASVIIVFISLLVGFERIYDFLFWLRVRRTLKTVRGY